MELPGPSEPNDDTCFCNLYQAYDALSPGLQQFLRQTRALHSGSYLIDRGEEQPTGTRQTRQRWQTMKKQKSNGEVSGRPRGQSMSHVFVDDSQDNMNLNDLVP